MEIESIKCILVVLYCLGHRSMPQLITSGRIYELISGKDIDGSSTSLEKYTAYFECGRHDGCGYVAKEKGDGKYTKKRIEDALNVGKYSAIWKKKIRDINGCASNPCWNGACTYRHSPYKCICNPGFSGKHCEKEIDECANSPCANGICIRKTNGRLCICPRGYYGQDCSEKIKSCIDIYRNGTRRNGIFSILGVNNEELEVYCDVESEANSTWTLVLSFALMNRHLVVAPYYKSQPRNSVSPNWEDYRLDKANMESIQNHTKLWRITCSFKTYKVDYRDYIRGKKQELNIMTFHRLGTCMKVEYVNIRGHKCSNCSAPFFQSDGHHFHIDSTSTGCDFKGSRGAVLSEDNFGFYNCPNSVFRCSENQQSTTEIWFGNYI